MTDAWRVQRESAMRAAVLAGDVCAWQTWHSEAFAALFAYARWRCGGRADCAEEIVQETWLVAVRRIADFDPKQASFLTWLRGIAANVLRNHRRRLRRVAPTVAFNGELPHPPAGLDQAERIADALATLPDHYEQVLREKYVDRRTVAEIAADRGDTPKAIESLLSRARDAFRKAYTEE